MGRAFGRQIAELHSEGIEKIYRVKGSDKSLKGRAELEKAIAALGTGDTLVIAEWPRAPWSMMDGIAILQRIANRGARARVLDPDYTLETSPATSPLQGMRLVPTYARWARTGSEARPRWQEDSHQARCANGSSSEAFGVRADRIREKAATGMAHTTLAYE